MTSLCLKRYDVKNIAHVEALLDVLPCSSKKKNRQITHTFWICSILCIILKSQPYFSSNGQRQFLWETKLFMFYVCSYFRIAQTLVYFGLTFYLPNLGGNSYLSLLVSGLIEVKSSPRNPPPRSSLPFPSTKHRCTGTLCIIFRYPHYCIHNSQWTLVLDVNSTSAAVSCSRVVY